MDIEQIRNDTLGCNSILHFDNAGAALMPNPVYEAVLGHLELERHVGGYCAHDEKWDELEAFYSRFARLLNCSAEEIAFAENATRAWDMLVYSIPFSRGDTVLTGNAEYVSNFLAFLQLEKRLGIKVVLVPDDEHGQIDVRALERAIDERTRLIAITHVPTSGGLVNPATEIGAIAKRHDVLYILDACQSAGQLAIDVKDIGCDFLTGTGRKFLRGPRGTGFLYASGHALERLEPVFIDLRSADWTGMRHYRFKGGAVRFETWESNVAGRIGLAVAVDYALDIGLNAIERRVKALAKRLRTRLTRLDGIRICDKGRELCGIVTFVSDSVPPLELKSRLRAENVNISVVELGSARLDLEPRSLETVARASVHYYNTEWEVDRFCELVDEILREV